MSGIKNSKISNEISGFVLVRRCLIFKVHKPLICAVFVTLKSVCSSLSARTILTNSPMNVNTFLKVFLKINRKVETTPGVLNHWYFFISIIF